LPIRLSAARLRPRGGRLLVLAGLATVAAVTALPAGSAAAHGFTSTAYATVSAPTEDSVRTELDLEYDLLVVSAAENQEDDDFFEEGMALFETGDEATALEHHPDTVLGYVADRFTVSTAGGRCSSALGGDFVVRQRDGVPYARVLLDHACPDPDAGEYEVRSSLFPDDEGYVTGTTTVVTYELAGRSGSAALEAGNPSFSTAQPWHERMVEFFVLGAEHLLFGIDHVLFLIALIIGSRRLRHIVLAATSFTLAHSVTFLLAALGLVDVPADVVEPVIALSIAVVAAWYLWAAWTRRGEQPERGPVAGRLGLTRGEWLRLGVVFGFGLVHGLGFAGALGIDEPWSWTLLWSLLVFNIGIEVVQLAIIALVFPLLALLRRRTPLVALVTSAAIAAGVTVVALVWFVQRLPGVA